MQILWQDLRYGARVMQELVNDANYHHAIEQACDECERELRAQSGLSMTYRLVIPQLELEGEAASLRSVWVFAFAPNGVSDIHKHSNSTQYTRSWRGGGRLRIGDPARAVEVNLPPAEPCEEEQQWVVIPPGVFHQAVAFETGWCVVSFQTVPGAELQDEPYEGEPHHYMSS
jgi:quercetin dioxygenase-like cupin family protein